MTKPILYGVFIGFLLYVVFSMIGYFIEKQTDTELRYKGQSYVLYGFKGEGFTHIGHLPVYSAVFVPERVYVKEKEEIKQRQE